MESACSKYSHPKECRVVERGRVLTLSLALTRTLPGSIAFKNGEASVSSSGKCTKIMGKNWKNWGGMKGYLRKKSTKISTSIDTDIQENDELMRMIDHNKSSSRLRNEKSSPLRSLNSKWNTNKAQLPPKSEHRAGVRSNLMVPTIKDKRVSFSRSRHSQAPSKDYVDLMTKMNILSLQRNNKIKELNVLGKECKHKRVFFSEKPNPKKYCKKSLTKDTFDKNLYELIEDSPENKMKKIKILKKNLRGIKMKKSSPPKLNANKARMLKITPSSDFAFSKKSVLDDLSILKEITPNKQDTKLLKKKTRSLSSIRKVTSNF
ncbi:unnamed protein product [Moneuplotes crassus]|uniref:Uncharacterized protein n=1 Tax=Euplotes crassus TaxID=5936 RepID=A0AAD1X6E8_EUPCR|nr:unnamed protein product [Moneuplotes crassus]